MLCLSPRSALAQPDADVQIAESSTGAAIDPGVDDIGLHCDDCVAQIEFPFPVWFYGKTHARAYVSSNGTLQFTAQPSNEYADTCLPTRVFDNTLFVLWDDLRLNEPGDGIFTSITGEAPDRVFNIEWRAHYYLQPGTANFEVRFFENSRNFEVIYGTYTNNTYTIGAQKGRASAAATSAVILRRPTRRARDSFSPTHPRAATARSPDIARSRRVLTISACSAMTALRA